jgi:hypothetical protein
MIIKDAFDSVIPFPQNRFEKHSGKTYEAAQWIRKSDGRLSAIDHLQAHMSSIFSSLSVVRGLSGGGPMSDFFLVLSGFCM